MTRTTQVVPFRAEHRALINDVIEAGGAPEHAELWRKVEELGTSITLLVDDRPVLCGGVVTTHYGHPLAWAAVDQEGRQHVPAIHRVAKSVLAEALKAMPRVFAQVVWDGFPLGHRWVQALGFKRLSIDRGFRPDSRLVATYALEAA